MKKLNYVSPEIEIMEIVIEKGFATSPEQALIISEWHDDKW